MVAALFALHPINVESVVWIAERKNVLSMLFFLLALGAYRWYASQPGVGRDSVVALLYTCGLMSKPQVITLPFVLLLLGLLAFRAYVRCERGAFVGGREDRSSSRTKYVVASIGKAPTLRSCRSQCGRHHARSERRRRADFASQISGFHSTRKCGSVVRAIYR